MLNMGLLTQGNGGGEQGKSLWKEPMMFKGCLKTSQVWTEVAYGKGLSIGCMSSNQGHRGGEVSTEKLPFKSRFSFIKNRQAPVFSPK